MSDPNRPGPGATALDLIRAQAQIQGDAPAIRHHDRTVSYRELMVAARTRAGELTAVGVSLGDRVAVETGPGVDFATGLLACWLLGAVPVPADPASPAHRRADQFRRAGCVACLTGPDADGVAAEVAARASASGLDRPAPTAADRAYILFTSGSTGLPKGVEVRQKGLANLLVQGARLLRLGPGRGMLAHSSPAFDMSLAEALVPLVCGATVVVAPDRAARNPERFADWLRDMPVHAAVATPTLLRMLMPYLRGALHDCVLVSGGEALPAMLAERLLAEFAAVWNGYGPTEATIAAMFASVRPPVSDPVPIGVPIPGVGAELLDERGDPVPPGIRGELCLSGIGLAAGYLDEPGLTRRAFGTGPAGNRVYRTGDICRQRADGQYEFHGRVDDQVKIRGQRIELGEIEAIAEWSSSVARAVAVVAEPEPGRAELYLALVPVPGCRPDPATVTTRLRERLPASLVPARVFVLAELPHNQAGKLDRLAVHQHIDEVLRAGCAALPSTGGT